MSLSNLHTNWKHGKSYTDDRDYDAKKSENPTLLNSVSGTDNLDAHYEGNSLAIGYGFDLIQNKEKLTKELLPFIKSKKSGLSDAQALDKVIEILNDGTSPSITKANLINSYITLSTRENAEKLLALKFKAYEDALTNALARDDLAPSKERLAVIDFMYQRMSPTSGALLSVASELVQAIRDDNRVAAWYALRTKYTEYAAASVRKGIANRRLHESDLFGLYSGSKGAMPINDNEAKQVFRFIQQHRKEYQGYINRIRSLGTANLELSVNDIDNNLLPAKTLLIDKYSQGTTIDGDIIIGQGIGESGEIYADKTVGSDTNLKGTEKNDLIFGERGDDVLFGGEGNDVLYGGSGDDILVGSTNILALDTQADILEGGEGFDTYYVGDKDTLKDSDGKGKIVFDGKVLNGGEPIEGEENKYKGKYGEIYSLDTTTNTLYISMGEKSITIKDYHQNSNDLGIYIGKEITVSLEDASAEEKEGYIVFKVKIDKALKEDLILKVKTKDGSATGGSDYEAQNANVVTIKAGSKEVIHKIPIASDGIYEKSEEFMLYAYSQADSYSGYDLGKVTFAGTALGTITDTKAPQSCPAPISPDFGFDFDVPLAPVVSAAGNYSSGGGGSYYYTGRTSSAPRVYNPSTPTITPPQPLPNVPVYECHYIPELSSVALISLPTACLPSTPPLVLDLNHDGTTSLSLAASLALFDYDNDGVKEHTAWIQNGDALLVADKNGDGVISDGSELFGDKTLKQDGTLASDGYDALKEYDTNDDGVINSLDNKFDELKLWMDNGDGITQEGELHTLTQENITSISLPTTTTTPIKENGNTITNTSTYTKDDGTLGDVKDIWFEYENIAEETYFDMDGDGFAEKMETWMEANQGVLVWDKNGDGIINSGKEILSNHIVTPQIKIYLNHTKYH